MMDKLHSIIDTLPFASRRREGRENTPIFKKELFSNPVVDIESKPVQLTRTPELGIYNDQLDWVNTTIKRTFFSRGNTGKNKLREWNSLLMAPLPHDRTSEIEKPDLTRARELIELNKIKSLQEDTIADVDRALSITRKLEDLENIGVQLIRNQHTVTVKFAGIPEMRSRNSEVIAPRSQGRDKPLAIHVGGYGNDPRGEGPAVQEIALNGQDVIGLGYPDSQTGIVNQEFADQVAGSPVLDAHAEYFKAVVRKIIEQYPGRKVELWGQSTGALVWATALNDPEFSELIQGVTFVHPAGSAEVPDQSFQFAAESLTLLGRPNRMLLYNYDVALKDRTGLPTNPHIVEENIKLRTEIWSEVKKRTRKDYSNLYTSAQVSTPNNKIYVIGQNDHVTRAYDASEKLSRSGMVLIDDGSGKHQDINTMADILIENIFAFRKTMNNLETIVN